jgi:hypothetical protein
MLVGALLTSGCWLTAVLLLAGALTLNQPLLAGLLRAYARVMRRPEVTCAWRISTRPSVDRPAN